MDIQIGNHASTTHIDVVFECKCGRTLDNCRCVGEVITRQVAKCGVFSTAKLLTVKNRLGSFLKSLGIVFLVLSVLLTHSDLLLLSQVVPLELFTLGNVDHFTGFVVELRNIY